MSELSVTEAAVGFHGKIPSRGDFIQRGLPQSFVDRWDRWLQEVLACTKAMAPDTWLDSYLTAPIWRFYMSPGVVDDSAWVGVVMPSVDNVNRYFPLTIASTASHSNLYQGIGENTDWFAAAEDIAFQALDDEQFDPDSIAAAIAGLPNWRRQKYCLPAGQPGLWSHTEWRRRMRYDHTARFADL